MSTSGQGTPDGQLARSYVWSPWDLFGKTTIRRLVEGLGGPVVPSPVVHAEGTGTSVSFPTEGDLRPLQESDQITVPTNQKPDRRHERSGRVTKTLRDLMQVM